MLLVVVGSASSSLMLIKSFIKHNSSETLVV
ncbi:hypothetical protein CaCOL14_004521 [Colletotrichum acutatum]